MMNPALTQKFRQSLAWLSSSLGTIDRASTPFASMNGSTIQLVGYRLYTPLKA
jgi:hypothetical protein